MTLHPEGKAGVSILKRRYDVIKDSIMEVLGQHDDPDFQTVCNEVDHRLGGSFDGKVMWYVVTVKLDLEARGTIERIAGKAPQRPRAVR